MAFRNRMAHLEKIHHGLDRQISELEQASSYDSEKIRDLKKHRLVIKDEIRRLHSQAFYHETLTINQDNK